MPEVVPGRVVQIAVMPGGSQGDPVLFLLDDKGRVWFSQGATPTALARYPLPDALDPDKRFGPGPR